MSEVAGPHGGAGGRAVSGKAQRRPRHSAGRRAGRGAGQRGDPGRRHRGHQRRQNRARHGRARHHHRPQSEPPAPARRHFQRPGGHAGFQRLDHRREPEDGRPGGGRGADSRRVGAQAGAARDDRQHEARRGGGGCGHRSGRLLRNLARHHPHRADLFRGWRAALLRFQHAGRGAAHLHLRAHQRHLPLSAGTGEPWPGRRLRAARRLCARA